MVMAPQSRLADGSRSAATRRAVARGPGKEQLGGGDRARWASRCPLLSSGVDTTLSQKSWLPLEEPDRAGMPASGGEPSKIGGTQKSWSRIEGIEQTHGWPPAFRQVVIRASLGRTRARHSKPGVV